MGNKRIVVFGQHTQDIRMDVVIFCNGIFDARPGPSPTAVSISANLFLSSFPHHGVLCSDETR